MMFPTFSQLLKKNHEKKVENLQEQMKALLQKKNSKDPISLQYSGQSNTTRSKSYKHNSSKLEVGSFDSIIEIDPEKKIALLEPRVTMEKLVKETLKYGLIPPVVPEFKGITVGGAVMGAAGESSSHKYGLFNDTCESFEILLGNGSVEKVTPEKNPEIFYGVAGSYGSLGAITSLEIRLIPAKEFVHLRYHVFTKANDAIECIQKLVHASKAPDYIDGIVFANDHAVIIEGNLQSKNELSKSLPRFSSNPCYAEWYYQHAKKVSKRDGYEEIMSLEDYLFRYDKGAFWVGAYLFRLSLLTRFIFQGLLKLPAKNKVTDEEVKRLHKVPDPNLFLRTLFSPLMPSQRLYWLLHKTEAWVHKKGIIQDFCMPEMNAASFLENVMKDPGTFPIWLCPIKGTKTPQIFSPHLVSNEDTFSHFINVGIYGLPSYYAPIEQITKKLEQQTRDYNGRKILYSSSFYTEEEFWKIYSFKDYELLRMNTSSKGIWHEITDKVLSI